MPKTPAPLPPPAIFALSHQVAQVQLRSLDAPGFQPPRRGAAALCLRCPGARA